MTRSIFFVQAMAAAAATTTEEISYSDRIGYSSTQKGE